MRVMVCIAILLAVAGCGYRPVGSGGVSALQPSVKTIGIGTLKNRTLRPTILPALKDALVRRFAAEGRIRVVEEGADVLLDGTIDGFGEEPLAFTKNDTANRLRLNISFSFTVKDRLEETVFLRDGVTGVAFYFTGTGISETRAAEDEATFRAIVDVAEQVVSRVLDGV
ncbi:LptE family protein [Candidatus Methylomirabilis sp.]|uniref:Lipopolysaccharide-assembly n=1 Tax=Candidatus Methylomirabilis tolerans TaxID=3123416 RepID=A0AAJ1EKC3_9BACT|nr:hypothetical protein [Candidatus Methylomirabilis sp.]